MDWEGVYGSGVGRALPTRRGWWADARGWVVGWASPLLNSVGGV